MIKKVKDLKKGETFVIDLFIPMIYKVILVDGYDIFIKGVEDTLGVFPIVRDFHDLDVQIVQDQVNQRISYVKDH
jgi:hypothetical protein